MIYYFYFIQNHVNCLHLIYELGNDIQFALISILMTLNLSICSYFPILLIVYNKFPSRHIPLKNLIIYLFVLLVLISLL